MGILQIHTQGTPQFAEAFLFVKARYELEYIAEHTVQPDIFVTLHEQTALIGVVGAIHATETNVLDVEAFCDNPHPRKAITGSDAFVPFVEVRNLTTAPQRTPDTFRSRDIIRILLCGLGLYMRTNNILYGSFISAEPLAIITETLKVYPFLTGNLVVAPQEPSERIFWEAYMARHTRNCYAFALKAPDQFLNILTEYNVEYP